jgi:hypothetical protein
MQQRNRFGSSGSVRSYGTINLSTSFGIYILLTVHLDVILVNEQLDALFPNVFISCLYMFRATSAHHQEGQTVLIHHLV